MKRILILIILLLISAIISTLTWTVLDPNDMPDTCYSISDQNMVRNWLNGSPFANSEIVPHHQINDTMKEWLQKAGLCGYYVQRHDEGVSVHAAPAHKVSVSSTLIQIRNAATLLTFFLLLILIFSVKPNRNTAFQPSD